MQKPEKISGDKEREVEEIKRRLDYLITTDEIPDSEKVAILNRALAIIEKSGNGEVLP